VAIEEQAARLGESNVRFEVRDAERLSELLKERPRIVLDFFGRSWVDAFCTYDLPQADASRLDAEEIAQLRGRLRKFYGHLFARHEALADLAGDAPPPFVMLDVVRRRTLPGKGPRDPTEPSEGAAEQGGRDTPPPALVAARESLHEERILATRWLSTSRQALLLGPAGSGKSALARWLVLSLLDPEPSVDGPGDPGEGFLPVWVPFGRWVAGIADGHRDLSLAGLLDTFFESYAEPELGRLVAGALRDERLLLVVDGLDEWTEADAAVTAGDRLQQTVAMRRAPALVCGRPEGIRALGARDPEWAVAELAPLCREQQADLLRSLGAHIEAAESVLARLRRERTLRPVAGSPLLLTVVFALGSDAQTLPATRSALLERFIAFLVGERARRRRAAGGVTGLLTLTDQEVLATLRALAMAAQSRPGGVLAARQARRVVAEHLEAELPELAEERRHEQTAAVLTESVGAIGLLQEGGRDELLFAHRALQEHLTAAAIAEWDLRRREELVRKRAAEPAWRGVIIELLHMALTAHDADALAEAAANAPTGTAEAWACMPLLAQVGAEVEQCSAEVRKRLVDDSVVRLEDDGPLSVRAAILEHLITHCDDPVVGAGIRERASRWQPGRARDRSSLIATMGEWPVGSATEETWWHCLLDEDTGTARAAGALLVDRHAGEIEPAKRLSALLSRPLAPGARTAVLEALLRGWPQHSRLGYLLGRARESPDPNLRLVGIGGRVRRGEHDETDRTLLLELADGWTHVDFARGDQRLEVLLTGWPRDEELKQLALRTVDRGSPERPLDITLAEALLLQGYHGDPDVAKWCEREAARDHPFVLLRNDAWRLVAEGFARNEGVVAAAEAYLQRNPLLVETCEAALVGRTPAGRRRLLDLLADEQRGGSAAWPFRTLLEGWQDDEEVLGALRAFALGPAVSAGEVAGSIREVLDEPEATERLLALVADANNRRPAGALYDLAGHQDADVRARAVELALPRAEERTPFSHVADILVAGFGDFEEPRQLAWAQLDSPGANLAAVGRAAVHDEGLRERLRDIACPLPTTLRERFAQALFEGVARRSLAYSLSVGWSLESHELAAGALASSHAQNVPQTGRKALRDVAEEALMAPEIEQPARRQAGLVVLLELRELTRFAEARFGFEPQRPLWVDLVRGLDPNWWLASRVAAHFDDVQAELGEEFTERLGAQRDAHGVWEVLAPFATTTPALQDALLAFVREHGTQGRAGLIRFLASVRPRSDELLDELVGRVSGTVVDRSPSRDALLLAADLLATHFRDDESVPDRLVSGNDRPPDAGTLLALAEGWPTHAQTGRQLESARQWGMPLPPDIAVRVNVMLASPANAADGLSDWLRYANGQSPHLAPPTRTVLWRLARDPEFGEALRRRVVESQHLTELASFPRLLAASGQLTGDARRIVIERRKHALDGDDVDLVALDLLHAAHRPLGEILHEALAGEPE
jgi:hypothetical protein